MDVTTHLTYLLTYLLTYVLTYSMEQSSSSEANRFSASQEIPRILWNPKVHYHSHKCPPPVPILSQLDPIHTPTSYFLNIHLNIILLSTPGSSKWSFSFRFPHQIHVYASILPHTRSSIGCFKTSVTTNHRCITSRKDEGLNMQKTKTMSIINCLKPECNCHLEKTLYPRPPPTHTHTHPYLLTPWSRVLLEKLTGSAASQEIPHLFGTRKFLTLSTSARHLSLS